MGLVQQRRITKRFPKEVYLKDVKRWWWLTCRKMTVAVGVDAHDKIVYTPPVVHKFKGQPIENLSRWMTKLGGFASEVKDA